MKPLCVCSACSARAARAARVVLRPAPPSGGTAGQRHRRRAGALAILAAAAALAAGLLARTAHAQEANPPEPAAASGRAAPAAQPVPTPAAAAAAAEPAVNAVTQAAVRQGVLTCAARINQVSRFVGFSAQAGAVLMSPPAQPDERLVPIVLETPTPQGGAYVSATFAPNQANGCGATYDAVAWWPDKCDAVAARSFAGLRNVGKLKKSITALDGGPATKVFLMPAGAGCVSIKKEVVL